MFPAFSRLKLNESQYTALLVVSRSIKKFFFLNCVDIYLFSIFYLFSIDFVGGKGWGYPILLISRFIKTEVI